jgi:hypothetical protein
MEVSAFVSPVVESSAILRSRLKSSRAGGLVMTGVALSFKIRTKIFF